MAGASEQTQRVSYVNANWTAAAAGAVGAFQLQIVTEDGVRHSVEMTGLDMTAVVAMVQASSVMLWDPIGRTLIAANLAGEWIQPTWSAGEPRRAGRPHGSRQRSS